jgi:hypothetical protein
VIRFCRGVVAFVSRKSKSKTKIAAPSALAQGLALFGPPLLLEGEDAAAYDELLARMCAAVHPADIIDEMLIADVVSSEWEVLRYRRLKWTLVQDVALESLQEFLVGQVGYDLYGEYAVDDLIEIFESKFPQDDQEELQMLARKFVQDEPDAVTKVTALLGRIELDIETILDNGRNRKAEELVQAYKRREPDAGTQVHELLTDAGKTMDEFLAGALTLKLDEIERIDRLISIAEDRRNASLREIDRRRVSLGETLRRSVREVEDAEFKVIETTPAKRTKAA